jgi:iron complex outermembrane recepter protein
MNRRTCCFSTTSIVALAAYILLGSAATASAESGPLTATAASPNASATPTASEPTTELAEIVITAQKRSESLQSVPISVSVVQGQALQGQNTNSLQDLGEILPDVHIVNTGTYGNSLNIRGIGSGNGNTGFDQSVAMFQDDIYYGRSRMIQSTFLDMDRSRIRSPFASPARLTATKDGFTTFTMTTN